MKRVLSFLLLVVLLVTAIPVAAIYGTETETEGETAVAMTEYDKLYVGADGGKTENGGTLKGLYTAFDLAEAAAIISAGKWHNKMDATGETDATVIDKVGDTWTAGEKAGFGYTWALADWNKDSKSPNAGISLPNDYASLPDFSVEASYTFHPLTDYNSTNKYATVAAFRIDRMAAIGFPTNCYGQTSNANNRSVLRWVITAKASLGHGGNSDPLIKDGATGTRYNFWWDVTSQNTYRANLDANTGVTAFYSKDTNAANAVVGSTEPYVTYGIFYNVGNVATKTFLNPSPLTYDQYAAMGDITDTRVGNISFFNDFPAEAYAIRVYDAVLTEAEKQHNHLIDLLAFYKVALPEGMVNNPALLDTAMASDFYATPFASDENGDSKGYDYSVIKKSLEDAIAALDICTLSVTVGKDVTAIPVVAGDSYTLTPPTVEGHTVFGWYVNGAALALDATVTVTEDTTATLLALPDMKISDEVSARVITATDAGELEKPIVGMRFTADVDRAALDLMASAGITVLGRGILITPKDYVTAAGAFTMEALEQYVSGQSVDAHRAYLNVPSDAFFDVSELAYTIAGGFGDFSQVTQEKNPLFAAIPYLQIDRDGDGEEDDLVYGCYEESKTVRVTSALIHALQNTSVTDPAYAVLQAAYHDFYMQNENGDLPSLDELIEPLDAPVISVKGGTTSEIVWDAVPDANGYIVTVNGRDYPEQTATSFTLPTVGEFTVTVRSAGLFDEFDSLPSNEISLKYGFDEENVVLSFAAISDIHIGNTTGGKKVKDIMLNTYAKYDVDAFMFPGDLTNAQNTGKYNTVKQMAIFAEYVAAGNAEKDLPIVWVLGNHDYPTYALEEELSFTTSLNRKDYTFAVGTTAYDAAMEMLAANNETGNFLSTDAWPLSDTTVPDGFRYNKISGFSFISIDYTHVTADNLTWLGTQMDALVAAEPEKQIFVTSHMPSTHSAQPAALTAFMEAYPQIVYISGHTHVPFQNASNVQERDGFVEIVMGPGNHATYGVSVSSSTYNSYQMKQGAIIEVDANGVMRVKALDYSFTEEEDGSITSTMDQSYQVVEDPMVIRTAYFTAPSATEQSRVIYDTVAATKEDERYFAPYFPDNSEAVFAEFSVTGGKVTFTAAEAANVLRYYTVQLMDMTTNKAVNIYDALAKSYKPSYSLPSYYIYHPTVGHVPDTVTFTLTPETELDASHEYGLYLKGVDDFGNATAQYTFFFAVTGESFMAKGQKMPKLLTTLNVSASGTASGDDYYRTSIKTSTTDVSDFILKVENLTVTQGTSKPKGMALTLVAGSGYAYDNSGFAVAFVNDRVLIYRCGKATGAHTSTGSASFKVAHYVGSAAVSAGSTGFTLRIIKNAENDTLDFYVNGVKAGSQLLIDDAYMLGGENGTNVNYTAFRIGMVPVYNNPVASGSAYTLNVGGNKYYANDNISFTLSYATDYSE